MANVVLNSPSNISSADTVQRIPRLTVAFLGIFLLLLPDSLKRQLVSDPVYRTLFIFTFASNFTRSLTETLVVVGTYSIFHEVFVQPWLKQAQLHAKSIQ